MEGHQRRCERANFVLIIVITALERIRIAI